MGPNPKIKWKKKSHGVEKVTKEMWKAFAEAFLCDIVVFSTKNGKQNTYTSGHKIFLNPLIILRDRENCSILYSRKYAKEFIEGIIFYIKFELDRELAKKLWSKEKKKAFNDLKTENELLMKKKDEDYEKSIAKLNISLDEANNSKKDAISTIEKFLKFTSYLINSLVLIEQDKTQEPTGFIDIVRKLQATADDCFAKSQKEESWEILSIWAGVSKKACTALSDCQIRNLCQKVEVEKVDVEEEDKKQQPVDNRKKLQVLCNHCRKTFERNDTLKLHCNHALGKECIKE